MEFRYRANDGDRPPPATHTPPTQSPPIPSFSILPARSISGVEQGEDNLREAIRREIEKEQIRHEIIVAEAARRRRELIAEVVQEMAIEKELLAMSRVTEKGMSLEDKLTLLINQRNNNLLSHKCTYSDPLISTGPYSLVTSPMMQLPSLQKLPEVTQVLESNKDKLIVLNRLDSVGAKRKAEDDQTEIERAKRKADGLCLAKDPPLPSPENKAEETTTNAKPIKSVETVSSKKVESEPKLKFKFWCEICGVGAFSKTVMRNHELGKKHLAAIKQQNNANQKSEAVIELGNANVHDDQKVAEMEAKETSEKKKKGRLWCEVCNIWTYSEKVMETHRLGKKHKALLMKQQNKQLTVLETNPITASVRSLNGDP